MRLVASAMAIAGTLAVPGGEPFEDAEAGYRVVAPGGWSVAPGGGGLGSTLRITPEGNPGTVQAQVEAKAAEVASAREALDVSLAYMRERSEYSEIEDAPFDVADGVAPGVSSLYDTADGATYRIAGCFVVEGGVRYKLQFHAPRDDWSEHIESFESIARSFSLEEPSEEALEARALSVAASRCGSEVEWARSWQEASARARDEGRWVLVGVHLEGGFEIDDPVRSGPMMDPFVLELVDAWFVPLAYRKGMGAPFEDQARYGMGPSTFGRGILLVTPGGDVVRQKYFLDETIVYRFLLEAVAELAAVRGWDDPPSAAPVELARHRIERGDLAGAEAMLAELGDDHDAEAWRLRGALAHRRRSGEAALEAYGRARAFGHPGEGAILVREVEVCLGLGRDGDARERLDRIFEKHGETPHTDAANVYAGACAFRAGDKERAEELWREVALGRPESRYGWLAAMILTSPLLDVPGAPFPTEWASEESQHTVRSIPAASSTDDVDLDQIEASAVEFLLDEQRSDGSWAAPFEIMSLDASSRANPFTLSITSVAALALSERDDPRCVEAVEQGLGFVLRTLEASRALEKPSYFMDYGVWSKGWMLRLLTHAHRAKLHDATALQRAMGELIDGLEDRQQANGGWSYYLSGEIDGEPTSQSISFVSAAVLLALVDARSAGIDVPDEVVDRGLDALRRMRGQNGAFAYFLHAGQEEGAATGQGGAAGRGPLCELALLRGEVAEVDDLRRGLQIFETHRAGIAKEVGKILMHAGPEGQGCHYPLLDYAIAAESLAYLPEGERGRHAAWIVESLLDARSVEGSFRDAEFNGWSYGTAMALLTLRAAAR